MLKTLIKTLFISVLALLYGYTPLALSTQDISPVLTRAEYTLGSSDIIEVIVFGEGDLTVRRQVNSRGNISFPLLGSVNIQGNTVGEVAEQLTILLKDGYLENPKINVSIFEYRQFYVRGEVKSPGGFSYLPGLTIGKAIALSGGFTERANRKKIKVSREKNEGERNDIDVNIQDSVVPGDILIVEESFF
ncbi:MAG: polysaccharide export protein [Pseudomonadales bacterium]|nr:polysaccharide export protein [Pseudomonadales bacterium]